MKRIHVLLLATLLAQCALLICLLRASTTRRGGSPAVGPSPTEVVHLETSGQVARAAELLQKIESGLVDPFAPPKPKGTPRKRTPKTGRTTNAYDRMLATTEGGLLVRADVADRIEATYASVLSALQLNDTERELVKTILVDLEMVKADIRSTHDGEMTAAEFDKAFQLAATEDIERLKQVLGAERYASAQAAYGRIRLDRMIQRVVDACSAFGVPLDDATRPKLVQAWSRNANWPKDLVVGSPLGNVPDLTVTHWEPLLRESEAFLSDAQLRCLKKSATSGW